MTRMRDIYTVKVYEVKSGIECFKSFKDFWSREDAIKYADNMMHSGHAIQIFQNVIAD